MLEAIIGFFLFFVFFKDFIYLFDRGTAREGTQAGGVGEGEAASRGAGSPMQGSIPASWDHYLSQRQTFNN